MSTEISVLDSGHGKTAMKTVRVRSGGPDRRTDIEVAVFESNIRHRRRRKERRGSKWTRGKLDLRFRTLDVPFERTPRSGTLSFSEGNAPFSEGNAPFGQPPRRERIRGRQFSERQQRIQKTIKGIPFNYFNTVNRLFSRLSVPSQRPYTDYTVSALMLKDGGNRVPLSVLGISTALLDLGYSQKDFVVGAKAVFFGDEIIVEPSKTDEQRINLECLEAGQGVLMLEYFALTNRVAHVFTKGHITAENYKKVYQNDTVIHPVPLQGLALCVAVCKELADSSVPLLLRKYEQTMNTQTGLSKTPAGKTPAGKMPVHLPAGVLPAQLPAGVLPVQLPAGMTAPQSAALKSSFSEMLSSTGTGVAQLALGTTATTVTKPVAVAAAPKSVAVAGGKKLTLADLAKGKK